MSKSAQSRIISSIIGAAIGAAAGALATALTDEKKKKMIKKTLAEAKKSLQQKIDEIVELAGDEGKEVLENVKQKALGKPAKKTKTKVKA